MVDPVDKFSSGLWEKFIPRFYMLALWAVTSEEEIWTVE